MGDNDGFACVKEWRRESGMKREIDFCFRQDVKCECVWFLRLFDALTILPYIVTNNVDDKISKLCHIQNNRMTNSHTFVRFAKSILHENVYIRHADDDCMSEHNFEREMRSSLSPCLSLVLVFSSLFLPFMHSSLFLFHFLIAFSLTPFAPCVCHRWN